MFDTRFDKILFARFFNAESTDHADPPHITVHEGFYGSLPLNTLAPDLGVLNVLDIMRMDGYLYNTFSKRYVLDQWRDYMTWDKADKQYYINDDFYQDFLHAAIANIITADDYYKIKAIDFNKIYDVKGKTVAYGLKTVSMYKGDDTITVGAREDSASNTIGSQTNTDTNTYGNTSDTQTNSKYAFDSAAWSNDSKTENSSVQHIDTLQTVNGSRTDSASATTGEQVTTKTYGTDQETTPAHTDIISESNYKTVADPEKLLYVQTELLKINAYKIVGDALVKTMCKNEWGGVI